jgi:hypothetical protein
MTSTRVGSDHNPLILEDGTADFVLGKRFLNFEMAWVSDPEFKRKLIEDWPKRNTRLLEKDEKGSVTIE